MILAVDYVFTCLHPLSNSTAESLSLFFLLYYPVNKWPRHPQEQNHDPPYGAQITTRMATKVQ